MGGSLDLGIRVYSGEDDWDTDHTEDTGKMFRKNY